MNRGEIWWASLPDASGSSPGYRRPVLVVQADAFNISKINTVVVLVITGNLRLVNAPGNVFITSKQSGLPRDSVINVSQVITVDKAFLTEFASTLSLKAFQQVENGLRLVLSL